MKKISTVARKQIRNFSQQKLTIGLDLGDRSSWYCVLDERGEVMLEQKLGTTPKVMKEVFGGMPRGRIALETGMHSPWVSRLLSESGHEVIVAHARNVRLIGESRKKDDRLDAQTLARLARIDRWQHRLKREHPTGTERTNSLPEECGWKGGDSSYSAGRKNVSHEKQKNPLDSDRPSHGRRFHSLTLNEWNGNLSPTTNPETLIEE
jgi:Transposase